MIYKISVLDSQGWMDYQTTNDINRMYLFVRKIVTENNYYGVMVKEYDKSKKTEKIILLRTLNKSKSLVLRKEKWYGKRINNKWG